MIFWVKENKNILNIIFVALISLLIFYFIYGELLDVNYDAWLFNSVDPVTNYLSWLFYRQSDWSWPPGMIKSYYPIAISIANSGIPLADIFFKIFSFLLPENFQYFGWWLLSCFLLQGIFAYLLIKKLLNNSILAIIGSIFFILSPVMLLRSDIHFALTAHWLILAAWYLVFRNAKKIQFLYWTILLLVSLLICPYIFFMSLFILFIDLLNLLVNKNINLIKFLKFLLIEVLICLFITYLLGYFTFEQTTDVGFGIFSLNLNALINPMGFSRLLPPLSSFPQQIEGFSYLGLGTIFLFVLSFYFFIKQKYYRQSWLKYWPLIIVCISLFLLSLSNQVTFNKNILFIFSIQNILLQNIFSTIRASARFFWPVYYLLVLFSFFTLRFFKIKIAVLILVFALLIQIFDISPLIFDLDKRFENKYFVNELDDNRWLELANKYDYVYFVPKLPHKEFAAFAMLAARQDLIINRAYLARPLPSLDSYNKNELANIKLAKLRPDTIYVFNQDDNIYLPSIKVLNYQSTTINNMLLVLPLDLK